jgi:hypothetical protein
VRLDESVTATILMVFILNNRVVLSITLLKMAIPTGKLRRVMGILRRLGKTASKTKSDRFGSKGNLEQV